MLFALLALSACWSAAYAEGTNDPVEDAIKGLIELVNKSREPAKDSKSASSGQAGTSSNSAGNSASSGPNRTTLDEYWHGELAEKGHVSIRLFSDGRVWVYRYFEDDDKERLDQECWHSVTGPSLVVTDESKAPIVEFRFVSAEGEFVQDGGKDYEGFPKRLSKGPLPAKSRGIGKWRKFTSGK